MPCSQAATRPLHQPTLPVVLLQVLYTCTPVHLYTCTPVHQPTLLVLLQGAEHAGGHRLQVLLRQPEQAGLPVLRGDEARPVLGGRG